jgi:hypothetical protein
MNGQNWEHDRWMDKITNALRSFRQAGLRIADQLQADAPRPARDPAKLSGDTRA